MYDPSRRSALQVALVYAALSLSWLMVSFVVFNQLVGPEGRNTPARSNASVIEDLVFVAVTAVVLYFLVLKIIRSRLFAERRLRSLFDSVNDSVFLFTLDGDGRPGRFLDANDLALNRLGYTHVELRKLSPVDIISPRFRKATLKASRDLTQHGRAVFETIQTNADGSEVPVEVSARLFPVEQTTLVVSVVRDISERRKIEKERREAVLAAERDKRRFYKETVLAMSGERLELGEPEDAEAWMSGAEIADRFLTAQQLSVARHEVMAWCRSRGIAGQIEEDFEVAVGEALTNALKHAGGGTVHAGVGEGGVWVGVRDEGPGIDTFIIPRVAFSPVFSTKPSMGLGYSLILRLCDRVKLSTGPAGTAVVLEKSLMSSPGVPSERLLGSLTLDH